MFRIFFAFVLWVNITWSLEIDRVFGASSFKFLKLPLSPRIVGMGGSGVAAAQDASALDLNPAAANLDGGLLNVGRGYPFSEFQANSNFITWSLPINAYRLLLNARYLGYDDLPGALETGIKTTDYSAHTLKLQAGLAGKWQAIGWGLTGNFAENNIAEAHYGTVMINAGLDYAVGDHIALGASAINADIWTSKAQYADNTNPFPPTALQVGAAYHQSIFSNFKVTVSADARTRNDEKMVFPIGLEVGWKDLLFARSGYPLGEQEPGIALGLGLHWEVFQVEYAFQSHETLSPGHYWSLGLRL